MIQNRFLFLLTFTVTLMATDDFSILPVGAKSEQWPQMAREAVVPTGHSVGVISDSRRVLVQHGLEVFFDLSDALDAKLVRTGMGETFDLHRRLN